jgi:beta-lactamase regulating signal transducer with metallopeptidase domain
MMPIERDFALLLKASWQGGVLILLVLAVQWVFRGRLNPRWRYGLWLLVMIRLALPWTVPSRASLFNLVHFAGASMSLAQARSTPGNSASGESRITANTQKEQPVGISARTPPIWAGHLRSNLNWLLALWSVGVLALATYLLVTHFRLSRKVSLHRPLIDAPVLNLLEDCKQQMGVRVPVTLVETAAVGSPSLFGFVRPRLLLPAGLARSFSLEELRCVFLHELGHIKRRDIQVGWLMTALQLVHWFNPLVWLACHRMRVDRELACDALALRYASEEENQRYGSTIIKLLESFGRPARAPSLAAAVENKNQLKERIQMIAKFKKTNRGLALAATLFAGLALVTFTDAQPATPQGEKDLHGTWVLVGRPGTVGAPPAAGGRVKLIAGSHWSVTQANPQTGATIFHHGGTFALNGDEYVESVEDANDSTAELVGKTFKFTIKMEGDTLTLIGIGNPWKEVWKRVKPDSSKPRKTEAAELQGKWRGHEAGESGTCSLLLQGSKLEYHGADTNEWYKANISYYDTTPKQAVVTITDCPFAQFVGATSYTIYQLQDGTLTITGNEPGFPAAPSSFDASEARKIVFKRE